MLKPVIVKSMKNSLERMVQTPYVNFSPIDSGKRFSREFPSGVVGSSWECVPYVGRLGVRVRSGVFAVVRSRLMNGPVSPAHMRTRLRSGRSRYLRMARAPV